MLALVVGVVIIGVLEWLSIRANHWGVWLLAQPYLVLGLFVLHLWGRPRLKRAWRFWTCQNMLASLPSPPQETMWVFDGTHVEGFDFQSNVFQPLSTTHAKMAFEAQQSQVSPETWSLIAQTMITSCDVLLIFPHPKGGWPFLFSKDWWQQNHTSSYGTTLLFRDLPKTSSFYPHWPIPKWLRAKLNTL